MPESIHGHDVMEFMLSTGENYTKDSLEKALNKKFGKNAQFHTCSKENMTAKQIIEFLDAKGKFLKSDEGFQTDRTKICNH